MEIELIFKIAAVGMIVAVLVMRSFAVISVYPFLIVSGCIAGAFTGLCAQFLIKRGSLEKTD